MRKDQKRRLQFTLTEERPQALLFSLQADLQAQEQRHFSFAQIVALALEALSKERQNVAPRKNTLFPK
jgi:hypothetical protein